MRMISIVLLLGLVACGDVVAKPTMESLGFEKKIQNLEYSYNTIYQHKISGNCYSLNNWTHGGSIPKVDCSDFGILTSEEIKKKQEDEEYQKYLQLKQKFGEK